MSTNFTLGQLIYRISQYNELQIRRPEDNSIHFWKTFVNEFFAENAIYKYGMLVSSGGSKYFEPFVLPARLLPRYYKALYQDNMRSCLCMLDNPQEYAPVVNTYILECSNARLVSVFDEAQICTYGSLKVTFSAQLKIENWVFDAHKHVEYISYASYEAKIASFMNNINAQLNFSPNTTNTNKTNQANEINNMKTEPTNSPIHMNGEKTNTSTNINNPNNITNMNNPNNTTNINTNNFLDMECNGISSPSTDLSLDNFLNNDDETSNNNTNNFGNNNENKLNNNNNINKTQLNGNSNSSNKSNSPNNDSADVLNFVRSQLQSTFKYNSPVNEYGITPQVMRCFEVSDILLSMEELMDYCMQAGCSPRTAIEMWVNAHSTFET